eukprot:1146700-Pelagomonas_calceolata.AAC.3
MTTLWKSKTCAGRDLCMSGKRLFTKSVLRETLQVAKVCPQWQGEFAQELAECAAAPGQEGALICLPIGQQSLDTMCS